ncbi:MAG: undecaprenyl-diphosphate phosphatase [Armatimonadetes bacterium]|nr:undecaprenyl-diphosphate phosphatase [Armatimonadota bacterium]
MNLFQAAVLGAVQGATEFIPVSSTGHLILIPYILGWPKAGLTFDLAAHVGTLVALLWYFWQEWVLIYTSLVRVIMNAGKCDQATRHRASVGVWILLASIPAALAGVALDKFVEETLHKSYVFIALSTGLVAFVMLAADRLGRKNRSWGEAGLRDWLGIGIAQALALLPGVSRSGITISAGLAEGLDRPAAARCSFLLSAPIIGGAAAMHIVKDVLHGGIPSSELKLFAVAALTSGLVGYLCIRFLLNYLRQHTLVPFVWYRVVLALFILSLVFVRR